MQFRSAGAWCYFFWSSSRHMLHSSASELAKQSSVANPRRGMILAAVGAKKS